MNKDIWGDIKRILFVIVTSPIWLTISILLALFDLLVYTIMLIISILSVPMVLLEYLETLDKYKE